MINYIVGFLLIIIAIFAFIGMLTTFRKKQKIAAILTPDNNQINKVKQKEKTIENNFEKLISKNSWSAYFLKQLENNHLWKIYAIITLFSILMVINQIFNFFVLDQGVVLIILLVTLILVIIVPNKIRASIMAKKVRRLSNDVPLLVDMLAVMIQSGMTVENALRFVKDKFTQINPDMSSVLERACLKMDITGINSALSLIYEEVPSREVKRLCASLQQSVNYGNSIYTILLTLSSEIREMQILETEEKISAASAKMTLPMMLFILFPILVVVLAPVAIRLVRMFSE